MCWAHCHSPIAHVSTAHAITMTNSLSDARYCPTGQSFAGLGLCFHYTQTNQNPYKAQTKSHYQCLECKRVVDDCCNGEVTNCNPQKDMNEDI